MNTTAWLRDRVCRTALVCLTAAAGAGAGTRAATLSEEAALVNRVGLKGGVVVHLGCGDGTRTARFRLGPPFIVQGLDTDPGVVEAARRNLSARGVSGPVSVDHWDGRHLPYPENFVNLIVADRPTRVSREELQRVLAPFGTALIRRGAGWEKVTKPWPKELDEWTHYLHGPDGNPVARDTKVGPPTRFQWMGLPRWARHHDHVASLTAMVSARGRCFYIADEGPRASIQLPARWRLVARDAFNGTVLWKREIPQWITTQFPLKSGPAHLLRRLVAVEDRVYVTLGIDAPTVALDAATGRTLTTYAGSEHTREIVVSDGVLLLVADTANSKLTDYRRTSTYTWANTRAANPGWGWDGSQRRILAYDTRSADLLWKAAAPVAPVSLVADGARVVFHDGKKLVCLSRKNGAVLWKSAPAPIRLPVWTDTGPRTLIYRNVVLFAGNDRKMSGWSIENGKKLWEQKKKPSGHMSLRDLYVVQGLVWTGAIANSRDDGVFAGYDPVTGDKKREFPPDVRIHWFHHRCYPAKATEKYLITGRNGTEFVDLDTGHWTPNNWVRGGCIYGVMPCNGLLYSTFSACACQLEARLSGLDALSSDPVPKPSPAMLAGETRLERGPAYGKSVGPAAGPGDWPTFRGNEARGGASPAPVAANLQGAWATRLGGRLSALTAAAGKVFVASVNAHTLYALDANNGRRLWAFTTGGRIDSPPTYYRGLVLFGGMDGYVYALRARDGALAWRFRAAPVDRRIMAWGQLESAWPVHGSVLLHNGTLYCTAGRNTFLDGGIRFLRLNPETGKLLGETVMNEKDPVTGKNMEIVYEKKVYGNTMPVALADVLSFSGKYIWMRSQKIDLDGKRHEIAVRPATDQPAEDFHLFCETGLLDDSYFYRAYWTYGRRITGGYGAWFEAGRFVPSGHILCVDDKAVYGFGRTPPYMVNASVLEYEIYAAEKTVSPEAIARVQAAGGRINSRSDYRSANASDWRLRYFFPRKDLSAVGVRWTLEQPSVLVRAMAVAGGVLFAAGPPNLVDERRAYRFPDDPKIKAALKEQAQALEGRKGGRLWAVSTESGKVLGRYRLDAVPVFDGLIAAAGRLYMATLDGRVVCLSPTGKTPLAPVRDEPLSIAWKTPEDPNYLLPPPVPKEKDFTTVARCSVVESKLGYRLRGRGEKRVGIALKKLADPITGSAVFTAKMKAAPPGGRLLSNGYLAFGDAPDDAHLVKCGARLRAKTLSIIQGPLLKGKRRGGAPLKANPDRLLNLTVQVDLDAGKVTFTLNKQKVTGRLDPPLKSIQWLGYAMDNAVIDFSPVIVRTPTPAKP
ncbi:MAG: PQQ-binding-like beta-propeller repeat protein [Kiritimatiellaeota bacterium]|nr:PQQ-binding-like beta-propeller repeat protein [Kiritimatiellota bacterium]